MMSTEKKIQHKVQRSIKYAIKCKRAGQLTTRDWNGPHLALPNTYIPRFTIHWVRINDTPTHHPYHYRVNHLVTRASQESVHFLETCIIHLKRGEDSTYQSTRTKICQLLQQEMTLDPLLPLLFSFFNDRWTQAISSSLPMLETMIDVFRALTHHPSLPSLELYLREMCLKLISCIVCDSLAGLEESPSTLHTRKLAIYTLALLLQRFPSYKTESIAILEQAIQPNRPKITRIGGLLTLVSIGKQEYRAYLSPEDNQYYLQRGGGS